jgi:hypothetical protein
METLVYFLHKFFLYETLDYYFDVTVWQKFTQKNTGLHADQGLAVNNLQFIILTPKPSTNI